ncbi:hypothetical protein [Micromonospora sp. NPDC047730]|uniref:hypothetical protein n=1 Tax=Micromonospora sp. NPDC047730 TaxID=3364253 RepID=UPI00370FC89B
MAEFLLKLAASGIVAILIKAISVAVGFALAWWLAALIALAIVFGGVLILTDGDF